MRALLPLLLLAALVAGCIQPAPPSSPGAGASSSPGAQPAMTGEETRKDATAPCLEGIGVEGAALPSAFCAVRTITVTGTLSGIATLPVDLATFSGPITVGEANEGAWSLVATLTARGATPDEAAAKLANVAFTWSHVEAGAHRIRAIAQANGSNDGGYAASLALTIPPSVAMQLSATDGSGAISVDGGSADALSLSTGSGAIHARARVADATLRTGSGSIDAALTPTATGAIRASTGSGKVALHVPEDADHGYALAASTGSGAIDVGLRDGDASPCPQSGPCDHREFHTRGFASRAIRTSLAVSTGSGGVSVQPA